MNIPLELMSRVLPRSLADPHSISSVARNAYRCAQRRSERRDGSSPVAMELMKPPAQDFVLRPHAFLAALSGYLFRCHQDTTP